MGEMNKKAVTSAVDAIGRCKQCGGPVTQFDKVTGPTGMFCSEECKSKHEAFTQRAGSLERKTGGTFFGLPRIFGKIISRVIVLAIVLLVIGVVGVMFEIPMLSPLVESVRTTLGI